MVKYNSVCMYVCTSYKILDDVKNGSTIRYLMMLIMVVILFLQMFLAMRSS